MLEVAAVSAAVVGGWVLLAAVAVFAAAVAVVAWSNWQLAEPVVQLVSDVGGVWMWG